jgi:hypothetical protein
MSDLEEEEAFAKAEREIHFVFMSYYESYDPIEWTVQGNFKYDPCRMHTLITRIFKKHPEIRWWEFGSTGTRFYIESNLTARSGRYTGHCDVSSYDWFNLCTRCEMRERYDPCEYCPRCVQEQSLILSKISSVVPQQTLSKDVLSIIKKYV